jgi:hypothetical protein
VIWCGQLVSVEIISGPGNRRYRSYSAALAQTK